MSLSLPAGTAASGSLRRPISRRRHQGNGGWRAGRLARPGPPSPRPLPWGGVPEGRGGGRGEKSPPHPQSFPGRPGRPCGVHLGPFISGCGGVPSLFSWGAPPLLHRLPCARAPFFSRQVCGSPAVCPPFRALTVGGGAAPPHPASRTWPPGLSPTWMYAIFARAHSLRPGHGAATATLPSPTGERGESKGGKEEKGSRWPQT